MTTSLCHSFVGVFYFSRFVTNIFTDLNTQHSTVFTKPLVFYYAAVILASFYLPEMEVTEILLAKVSRLFSSHSRGFIIRL
jgi:hypothetical protein